MHNNKNIIKIEEYNLCDTIIAIEKELSDLLNIRFWFLKKITYISKYDISWCTKNENFYSLISDGILWPSFYRIMIKSLKIFYYGIFATLFWTIIYVISKSTITLMSLELIINEGLYYFFILFIPILFCEVLYKTFLFTFISLIFWHFIKKKTNFKAKYGKKSFNLTFKKLIYHISLLDHLNKKTIIYLNVDKLTEKDKNNIIFLVKFCQSFFINIEWKYNL